MKTNLATAIMSNVFILIFEEADFAKIKIK